MKKILVIAAMAMATLTASAQFGGLVNKAKAKAQQAVKGKVQSEAPQSQTSEQTQGNVTVMKSGGMTVIKRQTDSSDTGSRSEGYTSTGGKGWPIVGEATEDHINIGYSPNIDGVEPRVTATYYPKTRTMVTESKYTNGQPITYAFMDDGTVMAKEINQPLGKITAEGDFSTSMVKDLHIDRATGKVLWEGEPLGEIDDNGEVWMFDNHWGEIANPMPKEYAAFYIFGRFWNAKVLGDAREKYYARFAKERQAIAANSKARAASGASSSGSSSSSSSGTKMTLYKGVNEVGEILPDGTIKIRGSEVGKIKPNGDIYVGLNQKGFIRSNGEVNYNGRWGRVNDRGEVYMESKMVGYFQNDGYVKASGGSIIGRVKNLSNKQWAAVVYFFGFFNL